MVKSRRLEIYREAIVRSQHTKRIQLDANVNSGFMRNLDRGRNDLYSILDCRDCLNRVDTCQHSVTS